MYRQRGEAIAAVSVTMEGWRAAATQCRAVGPPGMSCCQCFVEVASGAEVLELVVPAPVDDAEEVECAANWCVSVSGDEDVVLMPDACDFRTVVDGELVGDYLDSVSNPESEVGSR